MVDALEAEHTDKILLTMEERFGDLEEDGSNSYMICNLSPVKTAMHLLSLLAEIESRFSYSIQRTNNLSEIILEQSKAVLEGLFIPKQFRY